MDLKSPLFTPCFLADLGAPKQNGKNGWKLGARLTRTTRSLGEEGKAHVDFTTDLRRVPFSHVKVSPFSFFVASLALVCSHLFGPSPPLLPTIRSSPLHFVARLPRRGTIYSAHESDDVYANVPKRRLQPVGHGSGSSTESNTVDLLL